MKFSKLSIAAMGLAIIYCLCLLWQAFSLPPEDSSAALYPELGYAETFFDSSRVHIVDIQVSETDWAHLKKYAMSKECIDGTVTISNDTENAPAVSDKTTVNYIG